MKPSRALLIVACAVAFLAGAARGSTRDEPVAKAAEPEVRVWTDPQRGVTCYWIQSFGGGAMVSNALSCVRTKP